MDEVAIGRRNTLLHISIIQWKRISAVAFAKPSQEAKKLWRMMTTMTLLHWHWHWQWLWRLR
jgi:hypothetical protein